MPTSITIPLLVVGALLLVVLFIAWLLTLPVWLKAITARVRITPAEIIAVRLRGMSPSILIGAHIALLKSGAAPSLSSVETCYRQNKTRIACIDDLVSFYTDPQT
jgi:uncharacterized protein YqfA (UPF0365 family)